MSQFESQITTLPANSVTAPPPDVRKGLALPASPNISLGLRPHVFPGRQKPIHENYETIHLTTAYVRMSGPSSTIPSNFTRVARI